VQPLALVAHAHLGRLASDGRSDRDESLDCERNGERPDG